MAFVVYENNRDIVGSWYPTSFHGHFRNRPRTDYSIPYRERAKPAPPQKFLDHCKQRSNTHPFSQHDNRHAHSTGMGNLESYFGMGLGKRKVSSSQHYKNTQDLLMWSDKNEPFLSTYRSQFSPTPPPSKGTYNNTEPLHVRSNLEAQRRQLRVRSTPPRAQTAPLLAWNTTDEFLHVKPLVGSCTNRFADRISSQKVCLTGTLIPQTRSTSACQNSVVSETVTPLNTKS